LPGDVNTRLVRGVARNAARIKQPEELRASLRRVLDLLPEDAK
jgi:hypothetical protein